MPSLTDRSEEGEAGTCLGYPRNIRLVIFPIALRDSDLTDIFCWIKNIFWLKKFREYRANV